MAFFPLEPTLSRALVASIEFGCTNEVLTIVSILSSSSKLFVDATDTRDTAREAHTKFRHISGDHLTILNVVRAFEEVMASEGSEGKKASKAALKDWCIRQYVSFRCLTEAMEIRTQLRELCERQRIDWKTSCGDRESEERAVLRSLVQGLVQNTAFLQPDGRYKQTMGQSVSRA
jgi:ATP-dependent RNA helicase DHX33